ncbi:hypothetical protein MMC07_004031 [Pseudocyphellaria aurata]|nr:hypothetical protein [Pseudocyphellaria aurata]
MQSKILEHNTALRAREWQNRPPTSTVHVPSRVGGSFCTTGWAKRRVGKTSWRTCERSTAKSIREFGSPSRIGGIKSLLDILMQAEEGPEESRPKAKTRKVTTNEADSAAVLIRTQAEEVPEESRPKANARKVTTTNEAGLILMQAKKVLPEETLCPKAKATTTEADSVAGLILTQAKETPCPKANASKATEAGAAK